MGWTHGPGMNYCSKPLPKKYLVGSERIDAGFLRTSVSVGKSCDLFEVFDTRFSGLIEPVRSSASREHCQVIFKFKAEIPGNGPVPVHHAQEHRPSDPSIQI